MMNNDLPTPVSATDAPPAPELSADQALALDFALGILVDPVLGQAAARWAEEAGFARLVAGYQAMLDSDDEDASFGPDKPVPVPPAPGIWAAIAARIAPDTNS